jgi:hypothetical protein
MVGPVSFLRLFLTVDTGDFSQTGDVAFHMFLSRHFHEILRLDLPRWPGNRDCLSVYKRSPRLTLALGQHERSVETFQHIPADESLALQASSPYGDRLRAQARASMARDPP